MIDIVEILIHWHAGRPIAVVAESLGTDRKTIRKYVAPAEAAGLAPGGPPLSRDQWAALVRDWFPELTDPRARSRTHAVIDAHRERIAEMLKTNKATTVHQRLRDEHGLDVGISSFRRYVWLEFPDEALENKVTVLRPDGRRRRGGPDRLRLPGPVVRSDARTLEEGVGLRHGAGHEPPHVRPSDLSHGPQRLGGRAPRCVRVLRRRAAAPGRPTISRPGSSSPTSMTPSSTTPMPSWPSTTSA